MRQLSLLTLPRRRSWPALALPLFLFLFSGIVSPGRLRAQGGEPPDPPTTDNPTGNSGAFNGQVTTAGSYDPYTGNATRTIVDAVVPGAVGDYGLAFARTTNSRRELTVSYDAHFGDGGNWRHSHQWALTRGLSGNVYRYLVSYPDGRVVEFDDFSGPPGNGANLVAPKGISDQLVQVTPPGMVSDRALVLLLSDGGQVVFANRGRNVGTGSFIVFSDLYRAERLIDPHGAVTRLRYADEVRFNGEAVTNTTLLTEVDEPAGRSLHLLYDTYSYQNQNVGQPNYTIYQWTVLGRVQTVLGANVLTDVSYDYTLFGTSNGTFPPPNGPPNKVPYLVLATVLYNNEASVAQPGSTVSATYIYSENTEGGRPVLYVCEDPHFGGPMANIRYNFAPYAAQSAYPWGTLAAETHDVPTNPYSENVSQLYAANSANPYEVRYDGQRRDFHYGEATGPGGSGPTDAMAYNLTSYTDFQGQLSYQSYDAAGYLKTFTDRRGNVTSYTREPTTGRVTSVLLPDGLGSHRDYAYTDATHPYTGEPFYLYKSTDERGLATVIKRAHPDDANAHLVTEVDYPDQGMETFTYQAFTYPASDPNPATFYLLASRRTVLGATLTYAYDQAGHGGSGQPGLLTSSSRPKGNSDSERVTVNYYYDPFDRLIRVQDERLNNEWIGDNQGQGGYNGRQQVVRTTHADNSSVTLAYDDYGNLTTSTDELNHQTTVQYDEYRRPVAVTEAVNDPVSTVVSRTSTMSYERVLAGNGTASSPYGHTSSAWGTMTLPSGKTFRHIFRPNVTVAQDLAGLATDGQGNVTATADYTTTTYEYDPNDNLATAVQQVGGGVNRTTGFSYDARNRPQTQTAPNGTVSTFSYDAASNLLQVLPPADNQSDPAHGPLIYGDYDPMNRARLVQDPKGQQTRVTYDANGDVLTLTDADTHPPTRFDYDLLGRPRLTTYADTTTEAWTYDDAGNLASYQNRANRTQTFGVYDNRNRPTKYKWNDGGITPAVSMTFDAASRLATLTNDNSALSYTYNDANEPITETQALAGLSARTVTYNLNGDSLVQAITYPGGDTFRRNYNGRDELANVRVPRGAILGSYARNLDGTLASRALNNGTVTAFGYDTQGRINDTNTTLGGGDGATTISRRQYGYNPSDGLSWFKRSAEQPATITYVPNPAVPTQRASATSAKTGDAYLYDAAGQITKVLQDATMVNGGDAGNGNSYANTGAASPRHTYDWTYDAVGNRNKAGFDGLEIAYSIDTLNRYTSYGGSSSGTFSYDALGNTTTQLGWTYTYDAQGRLLNATNRPAGTPPSPAPGSYRNLQFSYDALGRCARRVTQTLAPGSYAVTATTTANLYYDGWDLIEERDENQNLRYRYVHGAGTDELICRLDAAGNPLYYHYDALGNVTHLTDASGAVVESYRYSAYGLAEIFDGQGNQLLTSEAYPNYVAYSGVGNRFLFKGREYLEAPGLYDCRNRMYSPQTGRFLQPDPAGFGASGANLYAYCGNDPVNLSDPSGLQDAPGTVVIQSSPPGGNVSSGGTHVDLSISLGGVGDGSRVANAKPEPAEPESSENTQPLAPNVRPPAAYRPGYSITQFGNAAAGFGFGGVPSPVDDPNRPIYTMEQFEQRVGEVARMSVRGVTTVGSFVPYPPVNITSRVIGAGLDAYEGNYAGAALSAVPFSQLKILRATRGSSIVAQNGRTVAGFTRHGINRAVGDASKRAGVKPNALLDALKNPKTITDGVDSKGRPFQVFTGQNARVVVSPRTGLIISTNPLSGAGAN